MKRKIHQLKQLKSSPLFLLYFTIFVAMLGFGMIFPLLPFYAKTFNADETTIGLLASSFAVAQLFFSTLWGRLSDRFGRKPIIALALFGISGSFLFFGLASNLPSLFLARFLQGVFSAAALPVAKAYAADITTKEKRTAAMGQLGAALALGFMVGPAFGGLLSEQNGLSFPFIAASAIAFLAFIFILFFLPEVIPQKTEKFVIKEGLLNLRDIWNGLKSNLLPYFIMIGLWSYGISNNQVAIPLFGMEKLNLSSVTIGWLFTIMSLASVVLQGFFLGIICQKLGEEKVIRAGLLIMVLGLFLMAFSSSVFFLAATMIILSIGSSLTRPTLNSIISKLTPEGQGTTMGVAMSFEAIGRILGPATGGFLFQALGGFGPFWISAFVIFLFLFLNNIKYFLKILKIKKLH